jgi:hypothetical protein
MDVVKRLESCGTQGGKTTKPCAISGCGQL